jgi:hypothetical protein
MTRGNVWKDQKTTRDLRMSRVQQSIIDDAYPRSRYQILNADALARISNINGYYDFVRLDGQYWDPPAKLDFNPTIMPVNLANWFVRKRVSWMFENPPDVECQKEQLDPTEKMTAEGYAPSPKQKKSDSAANSREQMLYDIYEDNSITERYLEAGQDYFIGGTVALKLLYNPANGIRMLFKPAQEVFPFASAENPDELDKVHFFSYLDNEQTIWKQTWEMVGGKCVLSEGIYDTTLKPKGKLKYDQTPTLLDFIPVILFPLNRMSGEVFGTSMLRDLIPLFDQYSRSMSDASDALRFNMFAIKVLAGAGPDGAKGLKVAPNAVWSTSNPESKAQVLESTFQYSDALKDFLMRLENLMHLLADVPDVTPEKMQGFGVVSGVALKLLYSDLVSATQQAWTVWKSRLQKSNEYIFRMVETYSGSKDPFYSYSSGDIDGKYKTRIIPHLPLPEDEMQKIQIEQMKLAASLQSVRGAMQEIGVENPDLLIAEAIGERQRMQPPDSSFGKFLNQREKIIGGNNAPDNANGTQVG